MKSRDSMGIGSVALALVIVLCISLQAYAAKTDVVILRNGDHITGEIKRLQGGRLRYSTDDMDNVYIEWEKIHHVTSVNRFEIIDVHGIRRFGSIGRTDTPGEIVVITPVGSDTMGVRTVVRITPIEASFIERISGDISVGFSYTRATKTAEATLGGNSDYRGEKYRSTLNYSAYITDQAETRTSRYDAGFSIDRFFRRRWTVGGAIQVEHIEELGLDLRTSLTASGSRFAVETNKTIVSFSLGISGTRETYIESDSTSYNLELPISLQYSRFTFQNPESDVKFSAYIYPSLTTKGRYRASLNLDFDYEVYEDLFFVIGAYYDYDSKPPQGAAKDDYRFSTSIKWSFG